METRAHERQLGRYSQSRRTFVEEIFVVERSRKLDDPKKWPDNLATQPSTATEAEAKVVREVQRAADDLDRLIVVL